MKRRTKLLTAVLTLTMGIATMGLLAGCDNDDGATKAEELISQAQITIDGKQAELEQKIADLTAAYQAKDSELLQSITAKEESIADLTTAYEAKIAELEQADGNNEQAIEDWTAEYEAKVAEIQQAIVELNNKITANKTELQQKIDNLKSEYETAIDNLESLIAEIQNTDKAQTEKITELEERLESISNIHTHEWGAAIVLQEPTCEEDGFFVQYCACGEDKLTVQNADGEHAWGENVVLSEATCTAFGGAIRLCEVCQTIEHMLLEKKPHCYDEYGLCVDCQPLSSRGLVFTLSRDETCYTITDNGSCNESKISIPATIYGKPVTSIGFGAFFGCTNLTEIIIPDSVTSIDWTFNACSSLTNIIVDENNTAYKSIDGNLYSKDGKTLVQYAIGQTATSFVIPDSVTSIGIGAFFGCTNLTEIIIPDGVTSIGNSAFADCINLQYNTKGNLKYLGNENNPYVYLAGTTATDITTATIENGCKIIGESVFSGCSSLTEIVVPNSVTSIGGYAFSNCSRLTEIVVPNGVTS
ncbi:MAG: leucine-rich repeat protein, partial [Clostridia bacterium]|nr:leucine-rich repeat protein [Clostridia bacterium]